MSILSITQQQEEVVIVQQHSYQTIIQRQNHSHNKSNKKIKTLMKSINRLYTCKNHYFNLIRQTKRTS
jgi:hypothetical protein